MHFQHYSSSNPANIQAVLNFRVDSGNTKLEMHFESGNRIREQIVEEIKKSSCPICSVLGDEATDCGSTEQMSTVLHYVDSDKEINGCFIKFVKCGVTGEASAKNIKDTMDEVRLPLDNCCGQGYDGASAMSSTRLVHSQKYHSPVARCGFYRAGASC